MGTGASTTASSRPSLLVKLRGPRTQASLFHYIDDTPRTSVWADVDWRSLLHPVRLIREEWNTPATLTSLFQRNQETSRRLHWQDLCSAIFGVAGTPLLVDSIFTDPEFQSAERSSFRTRRMEAGAISLLIHIAFVGVAVFLVYHHVEALPPEETRIFINTAPVYLPYESTGPDGGGGGGGGKMEKLPPSGGRMPETTRVQLVAPDPTDPQPLVPAEDLYSEQASVQMPIDIPQDESLPIGDIAAPMSDSRSSGPGRGGGIGTGTGTGVGPGSGPGVGPGSGGGMGGGSGGGIGSGVGPYVVGGGVKPPVAIVQPLPPYTEEARKARAEGIILIQAVIRRNGTVDSFKVVRGLGYGLDESAINTIATKWRFKPGTLNGIPVDVQANIEVSFRLY